MSQTGDQIKQWKQANNWQRILQQYGNLHKEKSRLWQDAWIVSQVGFAANQLNQYKLSRQYYDQQIALTPKDANAYYNRAYVDYLEGMDQRNNDLYRSAISYCKRSIKLREEFIPCLLVYGNCERRLDHYEEAANLYEQVCDAYQKETREFHQKFYKKHYIKACFGLAKSLLELEEPERALKFARNSARNDTTEIIAPVFHYYLQGEIHRAIGNLDDALTAYEQAKKQNPRKEWIHDRLGRVVSDQQKFGEANQHFTTALKRRRQGYIYVDKGINHLRAGEYSEALKAFEQALTRSKKSRHKIHLLQARVYMTQNKYEQAVPYYEQAIQSKIKAYQSDYPLAMWELGLAYQSLGKAAEAQPYLEEVEYSYPATPKNAMDSSVCFSGGVMYV